MDDEEFEVDVTGFLRDEGTIVLFTGILDDQAVIFACDHRPARDIADALAAGEHPVASVPPYMVWGD